MIAPAGEGVPAGANHAQWGALPWLLGATGALAGLLAWLLLDGTGAEVPWRVGAAACAVFAALALGFTFDPPRPIGPLMFSLIVGLVLGGLAFHVVHSGERVAGAEYGVGAGILASALALPLFQAGFVRERLATPYARVHFHVWTDAVAAGGAGGFALLSFLLLWLVHGLLSLIGIELVEDLIQQGWLVPMWMGGAFGVALGVLRGQMRVIGALQAVALLVLALLAVPLALALLVFLAALALSGGAALWQATDSATPVLLVCAAGCWVLANAVIRDDDAARSRSRVMQGAALVLAVGILPLAVFAGISMGVRIDQRGLSPERLWALVAIGVAVAFGLAYLVAVLRRRSGGWAEQLRTANLRLAAGVCVLALLLALPAVDFGAISARNQVARLAAGEVSAQEFDFAALRWDFGDAGRRALQRLAQGNGEVARLAGAALAQDERVYGPIFAEDEYELRVQPNDPELRRLAIEYFQATPIVCFDGCVVLELGRVAGGGRHIAIVHDSSYHTAVLGAKRPGARQREAEPPLLKDDSTVEVRTLTKRFILIDGRPLPQPLDDTATPLEGTPADR